jgi:cell pole-organizing protein PopZ
LRMPLTDRPLPMDEVITAIRCTIIDEEEAGEMISTSTFGEEARAKPIPEAGLLSREATAAVGSAFNTLTETVKKQHLPRVVERMVQAEIERVTRGR